MNTISKQIRSDSQGLTKTAFLTGLSLQGSQLQIGIGFSYTDANGLVLQPTDNTKKAMVIQASGLAAAANASDLDKAKATAAQTIYNDMLAAITPFINTLIDANITAV